jgi:hypothetical protein
MMNAISGNGTQSHQYSTYTPLIKFHCFYSGDEKVFNTGIIIIVVCIALSNETVNMIDWSRPSYFPTSQTKIHSSHPRNPTMGFCEIHPSV